MFEVCALLHYHSDVSTQSQNFLKPIGEFTLRSVEEALQLIIA